MGIGVYGCGAFPSTSSWSSRNPSTHIESQPRLILGPKTYIQPSSAACCFVIFGGLLRLRLIFLYESFMYGYRVCSEQSSPCMSCPARLLGVFVLSLDGLCECREVGVSTCNWSRNVFACDTWVDLGTYSSLHL